MNNNNIMDQPWHFGHLGEDYFLDIPAEVYLGRKWDVPIEIVLVGKSGEPYIKKRQGRQVNPNWAVIRSDGRQFKYTSNQKKLENGLWDKAHCNVYSWQEIRDYFESKKKIQLEKL